MGTTQKYSFMDLEGVSQDPTSLKALFGIVFSELNKCIKKCKLVFS